MRTTKTRRSPQKRQPRKKENEILATARKNFGYESLRSGQEDAIRALLNGRDCLVVQPTGSGKSAIYQIAALMLQGATLVVSPLIALQKDQVDSINAQDTAEALVINSTQRVSEARDTMDKIEGAVVSTSFSRLSNSANRRPSKRLRAPASRCSWWMRRTASVNGDTISAPTTSNSDRPSNVWATPSFSP